MAQILSRHKVVLAKSDGEVAFSYPVPIAELIFVPARNRGSPEVDLENPGMTRSLGTMLRTSAPIPGTKSRFAGVGVGAYLAYKPPVPETAKSVVIGRVMENAVETAIFKLARYEGTWAQTRVRWARTEHQDIVRYSQVVREVSLHRDGAISYGDLRALERGNWHLQAVQDVIALSEDGRPQPMQWLVQEMFENHSLPGEPSLVGVPRPLTQHWWERHAPLLSRTKQEQSTSERSGPLYASRTNIS